MQGRGWKRVNETGAERHGQEPPKANHSRHNYEENKSTHRRTRPLSNASIEGWGQDVPPLAKERYKRKLEIMGARERHRIESATAEKKGSENHTRACVHHIRARSQAHAQRQC